MKQYYLAFIASPTVEEDMAKLLQYGAYSVLEKGLVLICDDDIDEINKNHGTAAERDAICRVINSNAHVVVVSTKDLSAAWYLSEDSSNKLQQIFSI